jgi:hypothetical protein
MPVTLKGNLPLSPELSPTAQSAFVLNELQTGTLISLAQLCDDDCIVIFTKYNVKILKNDKVIITGTRMSNGLWSLPLKPPQHQANGILRTHKPKQELATYLHAALGSPVPSTLLLAIRRNHLVTVPGLTTNLVTKHLPKGSLQSSVIRTKKPNTCVRPKLSLLLPRSRHRNPISNRPLILRTITYLPCFLTRFKS